VSKNQIVTKRRGLNRTNVFLKARVVNHQRQRIQRRVPHPLTGNRIRMSTI